MTFNFFSQGWTGTERPALWLKEVAAYGKNAYVAGLLRLLEQQNPKKVFELGLGNGFPFAAALLEKNIEVHGCDVSQFLLDELAGKYPAIVWHHAGYDNMTEELHGETFDVVYCLRSSWYFSDILVALKNMLASARPGGVILFDIMNSESPDIITFKKVMRKEKYRTFFKNGVKFFLNKVARTNYVYGRAMDKNYPVSPRTIEAFLEKQKLSFQKFTFAQVAGERSDFDPQAFRILYVVRMPEVV